MVRPSSTVQSLIPVREQTKHPFFGNFQVLLNGLRGNWECSSLCCLGTFDSLDSAANTSSPYTIEFFVTAIAPFKKSHHIFDASCTDKTMHTSDSHLTCTLPTHRQQMLSDFALPWPEMFRQCKLPVEQWCDVLPKPTIQTQRHRKNFLTCVLPLLSSDTSSDKMNDISTNGNPFANQPMRKICFCVKFERLLQ